MAIVRTTSTLGLRVTDVMNADAVFNLDKIDTISGLLTSNNAGVSQIDATTSIALLKSTSITGTLDVSGATTLADLGEGVVHASAAGLLSSSLVVNADVHASAAIAWSKLNTAGSNLTDLSTRSHTSLTDKGTNTHAQIDTAVANSVAHLASSANPHTVTKAQVGLGAVENTALSTWAGTSNITTLGTITSGVWSGTRLLANKVPALLDEDTLGSNSATQAATQQSIKAYVDAQVIAAGTLFTGLTDTPASYVGEGSKFIAVNVAENALEFVVPTTDHTGLSNIGTNTHAQIDTHLANTSNPHTVTKAQVGLTSVEDTALSTWAGSANITTLGTVTSGDVDAIVTSSSVGLGNVENTALSTWAGSSNITTLGEIISVGDIDVPSSQAWNLGASVGNNNMTLGSGSSTVVISGNLQVDGTTVTVNTATLDVEDANITVNNGGNQATADDTAGLTVEMSDATDVTLLYDKDLESRWKAGDSGSEVALVNANQSPPEGSIIAWIGGYMGNGSNGSYTRVLGTDDTVAAVNTYLPANWRVCDGAALNDSSSTIFNGASRYLPNLQDSRFLMGATQAPAQAGSNVMTNHKHAISFASQSEDAHTHTMTHGHLDTIATANDNHNHSINDPGHNHDILGPGAAGGPASHPFGVGSGAGQPSGGKTTGISLGSNTHAHTITGGVTDFTGSTAAGSSHTHTISGDAGDGAADPTAGTTENRPQYLSCFYIMRVR